MMLPSRPIPRLEEAMPRLFAAAAPLLGERELTRARLFFGGLVPVLRCADRRLREAAHEGETDWSERATRNYYLALRGGLPFQNHFFLVLEDDSEKTTVVARAASLAAGLLAVAHEIERGSIEPDILAGVPLEMEQYRRTLFATVRIPDARHDRLVRREPWARHLVVAVHGAFWAVDAFVGDAPATAAELARAFEKIVLDAKATANTPAGPGPATALPREAWSAVRTSLAAEGASRSALEAVEDALFVVALDLDSFPADAPEMADLVRLGNLENRWFDKSLQLVVSGNGRAALTFEHSAVDGHNAMRVAAEAHARGTKASLVGSAAALSLRPLDFCPAPRVLGLLDDNRAFLQRERAGRRTLTFDAYGLGAERFRALRLGIDAPVQLAIQLAAYSIFGELPAVNESVQMRRFRHGRYDTVYTVTPESLAFVRDEGRDTAGARLRAAVDAHRRLVDACKRGESPVLYFTALLDAQEARSRVRVEPDGLSAFGRTVLSDRGFRELMHPRVTTSNAGARPGVDVFGFSDAEGGVLGVAYLVKADRTTIHVKADGELRSELPRFVARLSDALEFIAQLGVAG
ncbi:choline/carnitine O-acyltransferase [Nannocystis pusilla]|uniref:Choline/carnitine O-acyltransferase n=1 Tax=Nannocystis pusilla TaxID=889268 RepID=A0ABS7TR68_9BACT|nr:choline/carnitine O-acyltransferase [Nannocystis pusilla]MBZ5710723.1 choline/carnitine O-acyltransferase [Nannocystis pusilla]